MQLNKIYHGNCLEIMDFLPENSVDLLLTDPPLNLLVNAADIKRTPSKSKMGKFKGGNIVRTKHKWDEFTKKGYIEFMKDWISKCIPILKENCNFVTFISTENISYLNEIMESKGFKRRNHFAWIKTNPVPHLRKVNFAFGVELMMWYSRGKNTFNYKLGHQPNYFNSPVVRGKDFSHPTQKPLKLMELLIKYLSNKGDVVLDPFCGSGTTCVAAKKLGRKYIGIEIDEKYYKIALQRVNNVPERLEVFDERIY